MQLITQFASDSVQSQKVAQTVAALSASSGMATYYEYLNPALGFIATSVGIAVSVVFLISARRREARESEKHEIEMEFLRKRLNES